MDKPLVFISIFFCLYFLLWLAFLFFFLLLLFLVSTICGVCDLLRGCSWPGTWPWWHWLHCGDTVAHLLPSHVPTSLSTLPNLSIPPFAQFLSSMMSEWVSHAPSLQFAPTFFLFFYLFFFPFPLLLVQKWVILWVNRSQACGLLFGHVTRFQIWTKEFYKI